VISVVIVDDQPLARISLKATLNKHPELFYITGEAANGREAIALVQQHHTDAILMDIGMPVMDGIEATQQIRNINQDTKVIMLTTHEADSEILDAFRSGANSYCLKETSPETLVQVIQSTVQGASWIDPKIAQVVIKNSVQQSNPDALNLGGNADAVDLISPLTLREKEVLQLIAAGKNNTEITETLSLSMNTVKTHVKNIFMKLDVQDRTAAALKALRGQLIEPLE